MPGFNNLSGDTYGGVMFADNVCFDGTQRGTLVTTDGQLLIGSTVAPHIRVSTLTAGTGVTITNGNGTITIAANAGVVTETLTGNSGIASPTAGNINVVTANSTVKFVGSGSTLTQDFGLSNLCLGTTLPSLTSGTFNVSLGAGSTLNALAGGSLNTIVGYGTAPLLSGANNNTIIGGGSAGSLTSSVSNVIIGDSAGQTLSTGLGLNILIGHAVSASLATGVSNVIIGNSSGSAYTTSESSNIVIKNTGTAADSNVIRIGTSGSSTGQQNKCFVAGITGVTVSASAPVGVNSSGQLSSLGFGTATQVLTSNGAGSSPTWQAAGSIGTETLTGDDTTAVGPTAGGTINLNGLVVANGTHAKAVFTESPSINHENIDVQVGAAIAATDITKVGLLAMNSAQFTVDANGFVTLTGSAGSAITGVVPDAHTAPGTTPVVPTGGNITLEGGATFATNTQANPIRTNSLAANTIDFQIQLAGSNASTSSANKFGVAQFDSNVFSVTSGFVTTAATGPILTLTGNSGGALSPTSSNFNLLGTGSLTNVGSGSTLTMQLTGLTNHNVLIGAGTATITNVAPSATSGIPLISLGSSVDPNFGTAVVAGGGTGATTLTGVLVGNGTSAIQGYPITQYNVITAGASNAPNSVAPSATSGIPLISQGSASQPLFGTAVVAGGGTGDTSFTAYSVITGGTTSTGNLQNVSGVGTSGQILTSNGASTLPSWQSNTASFTPNSIINLADDFFSEFSGALSSFNSTYGWSNIGSSFQSSAVNSNSNPGILINNAITVGNIGAIFLSGISGTEVNTFILGGGSLTINWVFKIANLSIANPRYVLRIGLGDTTTTSDQANGVYFEYSDNVNSGNWVIKTAAAGTRTTTNSSTAVTTGWHNAQISVNAAASSITFTMDGVSLGTITTNIPTLGLTPMFWCNSTVGTTSVGTLYIDLFYLTQTLTSAR